MPFEKGNTINLGRKLSSEIRQRMSEAHKGIKPYEWGAGFKKENTPWNIRQNVARNAYFAGLVDGEGSIFITNNSNKDGIYKKVCVGVCMRADKAQPLFEGYKIWGGSLHERLPRKSNINKALDWRLWTKDAGRFLKDIKPFLRIKKKQAEMVLRYRWLQTRKHRRYAGIPSNKIENKEWDYRKRLEDQIKELNK